MPTGNFGDVLAGYYAKRMGLPVERLTIATNENDILARTLATGVYKPLGVKATQSPSMDIQVSSNFERLLFDAYGRDASAVRALMGGAEAVGRVHHRAAGAGRDPPRFRRRARRRGSLRGRDGARLSRQRSRRRSA